MGQADWIPEGMEKERAGIRKEVFVLTLGFGVGWAGLGSVLMSSIQYKMCIQGKKGDTEEDMDGGYSLGEHCNLKDWNHCESYFEVVDWKR